MKLNKLAIVYNPENGIKRDRKILAIAAHQDDIEIFGYSGIRAANEEDTYSFVGVVTSDGRNSPRIGEYANYDAQMMIDTRIVEQKGAADIGKYEAQILLNYTSEQCQTNTNEDIIADYIEIIREYKPEIILTHNLADKHKTHCGVVCNLIKAIRRLPVEERPKYLLGCEVWRDLDWMSDDEKIVMNCGENEQLQLDLLNVFRSQVVGGKRYDLATVGRRYSNATFSASHGVDSFKMTNYAMDLTPLIVDDNLSIGDFVQSKIDDFKKEVNDLLKDLI